MISTYAEPNPVSKCPGIVNHKMSDKYLQQSVAELLSSVAVPQPAPINTLNRSAATMNAVKAHILSNNLAPGDPLPTEAALAADLGVSRSSVREALRKLEALDIVGVKQGSGSFVGNMSLEPMVETLVLRASLSEAGNRDFLREVAEARQAMDLGMASTVVDAHRGRPDEALQELVEEMVARSKEGHGFMNQDIAFHRTLLAPLNNQLLRQMYQSFWLVHTSIIPNLESETEGSGLRTAYSHRHMLDAATDGDVDAYRAAVVEHYEPLLDILS